MRSPTDSALQMLREGGTEGAVHVRAPDSVLQMCCPACSSAILPAGGRPAKGQSLLHPDLPLGQLEMLFLHLKKMSSLVMTHMLAKGYILWHSPNPHPSPNKHENLPASLINKKSSTLSKQSSFLLCMALPPDSVTSLGWMASPQTLELVL